MDKKEFIRILRIENMNIDRTCKILGIHRQEYYKLKFSDFEFAKDINDLNEEILLKCKQLLRESKLKRINDVI